MQEHLAATDSGRQQRAIASTLATTGAGHPLLVEQATQIRVDQTAFISLTALHRTVSGNLSPVCHRAKSLRLKIRVILTSKPYPIRA